MDSVYNHAENDIYSRHFQIQIRDFMEVTEEKCHVELIFKDISTVRHDPKRLFKWEKIAMEVGDEYSR
ncbi:MAG: hypothetical protein PHS82_01530 [Lachnospiraceae bacterium]|nr:hypothetical protein [Lachnospiraceae bacterium]